MSKIAKNKAVPDGRQTKSRIKKLSEEINILYLFITCRRYACRKGNQEDSTIPHSIINGMNPRASPGPVFDASVGESTHALVRP